MGLFDRKPKVKDDGIKDEFERAIHALGEVALKEAANKNVPNNARFTQQSVINPTIAKLSQSIANSYGKTPQDVMDALAQQGLTFSAPFSPGAPLTPYFEFGSAPRTRDYEVGQNIGLTPRAERNVGFDTLKDIIESYYAAQIAIRHLINDVRSIDYQFVPPMNVLEDASDDLQKAQELMAFPDGRLPFRSWIAKFMQDILRYDAGALYIRRNKANEPIALEIISGTTIIPLVDFFGRTPADEVDDGVIEKIRELGGTWNGGKVPAFVQVIKGMPFAWLTVDDLIYTPLNPLPESSYGLAPMEAVLMQANTDIRFQWFFLQHFTEGTVPAGFMEAPPDLSNPTQIQEWQQIWDAVMLGDQAKLNQVRWVPAGANFKETKDHKFDSSFSLYLMRCTAAAFGVTPNDLGFTEDVNRSTGETQVDVQFRVGTLPLIRHIEDIINFYLSHHLGLKARLQFDVGQNSSHKLEIAQADDIYIKNGTKSLDEVRMGLGYRVSRGRPTPRFIYNEKSGPISLLAIESVSGVTDPTTFGPSAEQPKVKQPFVSAPGVLPVKSSGSAKDSAATEVALADKLAGRKTPKAVTAPKPAVKTPAKISAKSPAKSPTKPPTKPPAKSDDLDKETTAGITSSTGATGIYQLKKETVIRQWRDNSITRVSKGLTPKLFTELPEEISTPIWEKLQFAKSKDDVLDAFTPEHSPPKVAGVVVQALDTNRVLMVQRTPDKHDDDNAYARWEFPGGHLDPTDNSILEGAIREWQEEVGCDIPPYNLIGGWTSDIYQGFIVTIDSELQVHPDPQPEEVSNVKWWDVDDLTDNEIRDKVVEALPLIDPVIDPSNTRLEKADWASFHIHTQAIISNYIPFLTNELQQLITNTTLENAIRAAYMAKTGRNRNSIEAKVTLPVEDIEKLDTIGESAMVVLKSGIRPVTKIKRLMRKLYAEAFTQGVNEASKELHIKPDTQPSPALQEIYSESHGIIAGFVHTYIFNMAKNIQKAIWTDSSPESTKEQALSSNHAKIIVDTEYIRAYVKALIHTYSRNNVTMLQWVTEPGACQLCVENEDASPIQIGGIWPNGPIPVHPNERCIIVPYRR